ncbi:MAG: hypothetical protein K5662_08810 [Lachnospiraceae bacterium]|nr:hypothetical protein [Lachnospiraceae bacterium]
MNEEQFAKIIEELNELAAAHGNVLSRALVEERFAEVGLKGDALSHVYDYFRSKKIGIDEAVDPEEYMTAEDIDYVQLYMDSIEAIPTYTDSEKRAFAMSAMAGEKDAQDRIVEIMIPSVVDMAKLYAGQGATMEDIIGEGNLALSVGVTMLGALETPDEVEGTLAGMIMDAMEEFIGMEDDARKIDKNIEKKVNKVADAARELAEDLGRKVTVEELITEGLSEKAIRDAIKLTAGRIEDIEYDGE